MSLPEAVTQETRAMRPYRKFEGHTSDVLDVIHLPCGQRIMTCSRDSSLRVWDLQSGKQIGNDWRDGESIVSTIALSPDGKKVASGSEDGAVRLWDADTGNVTAKWTGHTDHIISVCWSQDGGQVVSGSYGDETTRVWDAKSGKTVLAIETGFSKVGSVIYSPDMTMIAIGGYNEEQLGEEPLEEKELLKIWDAKTGKLVANLKGHPYPGSFPPLSRDAQF
jgi:WD40 repeat protein